jgi:GH43 family beta-xylosidase
MPSRCIAIPVLLVLHWLLATPLCGQRSATERPALKWRNPLVPKRADPHVTLHTDGFYYMTASVPEYDRIEVRRARTLADLGTATAKTVWVRHKSGPMSGFIWAPELHFIDGKWFLYVAAGEAPSGWNIKMYVLECLEADPLDGRWHVRGRIDTGWDSFTLDATTFVHLGVRYLLWAQTPPGKPGTHVYIARMDTPVTIKGSAVCLTEPTFDWELRGGVRVNEGPAVLIRHGRVFMTYSASATDSNYCVGMLTADANANLLNPSSWKKSPEPVLATSAETSQFGPGHNSFTTTPDGKVDIIVYHARAYRDIIGDPLFNPDRATRAQVIQWSDTGMPLFGPPVEDGIVQVSERDYLKADSLSKVRSPIGRGEK